MNDPSFFVTGGPLRSDDPSYVERSADRELWEQLASGEYCYVLTPRQMGKSSLMARTARRLRARGTRVAAVDLTAIGGESKQSEEAWYYGLLYRIHKDVKLLAPLKSWWEERDGLTVPQRFVEFFREVVLLGAKEVEEDVVVFLDEIDATIRLPFASSFFAAVRACYNARALEAEFDRLSFVLLGVATPDQLISDAERTPFNIGQRIELNPFSFDETTTLARGFGDDVPPGALERVLYWSGGQPYLTQSLCKLLIEAVPYTPGQGSRDSVPFAWVDSLVEEHILTSSALREETHLSNIQKRLLDQPGARARLLLLEQVHHGKVITDSPTSWVVSALKLSGIVRPDSAGVLKLSNRIYGHVFDRSWIESNLPTDWSRLVVTATLTAATLLTLAWYRWVEPRSWVRQLSVTNDYAVAELAHQSLSMMWLYPQARADEQLAQFWDRRAGTAEQRNNRDVEFLNRLRAIEASDSELRRSRASELMGTDWVQLRSTLRHDSSVLAVSFSPDGKAVLTGSYDNTARLWQAESGVPIGEPMRHQSPVIAVAFSPDGKTILTGSYDNTARLWRADSGAPISDPLRHEDWVVTVAFSPDGKTVLTGSYDNSARLWRADSGAPLGAPLNHEDWVVAAAFSPDGKTVLTGSYDNSARLWQTDSGEPVGGPMYHDYWVRAVAFSSDGKTVLTGGYDDTARLWQVDSGAPIGEPMRHEDWVVAVAFSPDGKTVLTGSYDNSARLWAADSGTPIGKPMRHRNWVLAAAFSSDGKTVLTGSHDRSAELWQASSGERTGEPMRHASPVLAVAFSPDGKAVITGSDDGTARVRSLSLDPPTDVSSRWDPSMVLDDWLARLALRFDSQQRLEPRWPTPHPHSTGPKPLREERGSSSGRLSQEAQWSARPPFTERHGDPH